VAYQQGRHAQTPFTTTWRGDSLTLAIGPVQGDAALTPAQRSYAVKIHAVENGAVTLTRNGKGERVEADYAADAQTLSVALAAVRPGERIELIVNAQGAALLASADRRAAEVRRLLTAFRLGSLVKWQIDTDLPQLLTGAATLARYPLTPGQQQALHHALARAV